MFGAIDIGGTKIAVGLVTETGELVDSVSLPTLAEQTYHAGLGNIIRVLEGMVQSNKVSIGGVGIGVTGRITPDGILLPNQFLPAWSGQDPARDLGYYFRVTGAIENDADAVALAEYQWGSCKGAERLVYVTVSTGIGGGIILGGKLYRGVDGSHPEIGHHVIDPNGPICFCGAHGCWESMASGTAMAAWTREKGGEPGWDARLICDQAEQGNSIAIHAIEREAHHLGLGLANLITIFAPDCILLGGGLMQRWELFRENVEAVIQRHCKLIPKDRVKLSTSRLQHPGLVGAAATWTHHFGDRYDI